MGDGVDGVLMEEAEDMVMVGARVIAEKAEDIAAEDIAAEDIAAEDIAAEAEMGEGEEEEIAVAVVAEGEVIEAMKLGQQIKGDGVI
jgi:uncharacterized iron-regulated protein